MNIHEYQSKAILKSYGVNVPEGYPAFSAEEAVENAKILEVVAEMNYHALQLTRADIRVPQFLLDKHYYRKHGANAYYGQNNAKSKSGATHKYGQPPAARRRRKPNTGSCSTLQEGIHQ